MIFDDVAVVPGTDRGPDGRPRKMSKSYGNTIGLFEEGKALKKKPSPSIVTDSTPARGRPKTPTPTPRVRASSGSSPLGRAARARSRRPTAPAATATATPRSVLLTSLISDHFAEARERRRAAAERPPRDGPRGARSPAPETAAHARALEVRDASASARPSGLRMSSGFVTCPWSIRRLLGRVPRSTWGRDVLIDDSMTNDRRHPTRA